MPSPDLAESRERYLSPKLIDHLCLNKYFMSLSSGSKTSRYEAFGNLLRNHEKLKSALDDGLLLPKKLPLCAGCGNLYTPEWDIVCEAPYVDDFLEEFVRSTGELTKREEIEYSFLAPSPDGDFRSYHVGPIEISGSACIECVGLRTDTQKREESRDLVRRDRDAWLSSMFSKIFPHHIRECYG